MRGKGKPMKALLIILLIVAIATTACTDLQVIEKNRYYTNQTNTTINITTTIYNNSVINITNNITYIDDNNITENLTVKHDINDNINVTICRLDGTCFTSGVPDFQGIKVEVDPIWTANSTYVYGNDTYLWNAIQNISLNETDPYWTANSTLVAYINATNIFTQDQNFTNHSLLDVNVLYVHNITGRSPIIITNDLIGTGTNFFADNFYGNFNGTNGTIYGVTINNGTIVNLHVTDQAYFDSNIFVNGTVNATDYNLYGDDIWIYKDNRVFYFNVTKLSEYLLNSTNATNLTILLPSAPYLYNDSQYIYLNETKLNSTINSIAKNKARTYNYTIVGVGQSTSTINISYLITNIKVLPSSNTSAYRFQLQETNGNVIDRDRTVHLGVWDIEKNYALNNQVTANITFNPVPVTFNIIVTYVENGVTI